MWKTFKDKMAIGAIDNGDRQTQVKGENERIEKRGHMQIMI